MIYHLINRKTARQFYDYILILGQSNMDGRAPISGFDLKYQQSNTRFKSWTSALYNYNTPANAAWSWVFMHEIIDRVRGENLVCIRVTEGGTGCHPGAKWNIVGGTLLATTLSRIRGIKSYATSIGKIARCTGILWDQKESDVGYPTYVQYVNGQLQGDFVDTINAIKITTGGNPWIIFAELMTYQGVGNIQTRTDMIAMQRLYAEHTPNAYLLPMNDNQFNIPANDNLHYNAVGTTFVGLMAKNILIANNLQI